MYTSKYLNNPQLMTSDLGNIAVKMNNLKNPIRWPSKNICFAGMVQKENQSDLFKELEALHKTRLILQSKSWAMR